MAGHRRDPAAPKPVAEFAGIYVHPVVLGAGNPLFRPGTGLRLALTGSRQFANGVLLLRYEPG